MNKRDFIKAFSAGLVWSTAPGFLKSCTSTPSKKVLILGGRNFVGPSIVDVFHKAGWEVTLLNRGLTNPELFQELPVIICDREKEHRSDLRKNSTKIKSNYWNCVIDTWQKSPKAVRDFIEEFKDNFTHYHYISSISVYKDWNAKGMDETSPVKSLPEFPKTIHEEFRYSLRKTFSEASIQRQLDKYTIYRSHGMRDFRTPDHSKPNEEDYWPIRFARGGNIVVPQASDHYYQITDVKSLCNFILHCAENKIYGIYNVAYEPFSFKTYVKHLIEATQKVHQLYWIPGAFLIKNGLKPYRDISAWKVSPAGFYRFSVQKALSKGLKNRNLTQLIRDQLRGYKSRYPKDDIRFGETMNGHYAGDFSLEKEKEILQKWQSESKNKNT